MDKLKKIGKFVAESSDLANEIKGILIKQGFVTSQCDEFDHVIHVFKKI